MDTYADLIKAALSLVMGSQVRLTRRNRTDGAEGVEGTLVTVSVCPRLGFTSVFILWDDEERAAEYRLGRDLNMPMHWNPITVEQVNWRTEDPRVMDARIEVAERMAAEARQQRDAALTLNV